MWGGMRMVSEDYLGLNDQLVLAVSHSKLLKSQYNEFIQLVDFETFGIYNCGIPNHGMLAPK